MLCNKKELYMRISLKFKMILAAGATVLATTSAFAGPRHRPWETAVDRAIADCETTSAALTIGGLILGARGGDAFEGARAGADLSSVMCDIMLAAATEEDRRAIEENERRALSSNKTRRRSYRVKGQRHTVETRVYTYRNRNEGGKRVCRYTENRISVEGKRGLARTDKQLYCKSGDGQWKPAKKG
jgi:surface antigen